MLKLLVVITVERGYFGPIFYVTFHVEKALHNCIVVLFVIYVNEDFMSLILTRGSFIQIWPLSGCIFCFSWWPK